MHFDKNLIPTTLVLFLFSSALSTFAQNTPAKPTFQAVYTDRPISLSGKLDDPAWQQAIPVEMNYEIQPGENTFARQRTKVFALYDKEKLYLGFQCHDSAPQNIRAHLTDRDKMYTDDFVIASIDTYNNYQRGYEFAVNPLGIQGDLLMMGQEEDELYDMVWESATARNEKGWTAEMAIPFKNFTFSSNPEQTWTISLIRNHPRDSRYITAWTPLDRNNPSYMGQGGLLTGLRNIKPGRSLELLPYIMAQQAGSRSDIQNPEAPMDNDPVKARIGGGIHYAPGPAFALDAVINPDFSQIESDAEQISVNTTFALYYPEKRPFFMSGSDLLQSSMYYSRTINNPLVASKVTGKVGKLSYIALGALDRNTGIIVPGEELSNTVETALNSYAGVGRLRYDIGNENYIGGLWLSRNFTAGHNYVTGLDWNFKFWKNWYLGGELYLSHTSELSDSALFGSTREFGSTGFNAAFNGEQYFGRGLDITLKREARNYSFYLQQVNFSPTFQTYNGIHPSVGTRNSFMTHQYVFHPNGKYMQTAALLVVSQLKFNYDGLFKEFVIQPGFSLSLIGQTRINASYLLINTERFRDVLFTGIRRLQFNAQTRPISGLIFSINGQVGKFIYRSQNPDTGKGFNLGSTLTVDPTSRLKSSFTISYARLSDYEDGQLFYSGYILRTTTSYQFTRKLFLRAIFEYNSFGDAFNVYPLLSYKFNPFTMLCAGMTQDLQYYDSEEEYLFKPVSHQYFIKLQYLFSK